MSFLLDTCFVSDIRRKRTDLQAWLGSVRAYDVFVSVITVGELARGIHQRRRKDPIAAKLLQQWLDEMRLGFARRILPVTEPIADLWGELSAQRPRPVADALIAATALVHGLAVVTRNVADFADTGVAIVNPWETA